MLRVFRDLQEAGVEESVGCYASSLCRADAGRGLIYDLNFFNQLELTAREHVMAEILGGIMSV